MYINDSIIFAEYDPEKVGELGTDLPVHAAGSSYIPELRLHFMNEWMKFENDDRERPLLAQDRAREASESWRQTNDICPQSRRLLGRSIPGPAAAGIRRAVLSMISASSQTVVENLERVENLSLEDKRWASASLVYEEIMNERRLRFNDILMHGSEEGDRVIESSRSHHM